jgi:hypothetical protein
MLARIDRMGEETVNKALESLNKEVHTAQLRNWITNFINA